MTKLFMGLVIALATPALIYATAATLAGELTIAVTGRTLAEYTAATERASAKYQAARAECEFFNGNGKDICVAAAQAAEKRAKADAKARYMGTINSRTDARIAGANANYPVVKAICTGRPDSEKVACLKEAKVKGTKTLADARANRKAAESRKDSLGSEYVAWARGDRLSAEAEDFCVSSVKAKSGK